MDGPAGFSLDYNAIRNALRVKTRKRNCPACEFEGGWNGAKELARFDVGHREGGNGKPPRGDAEPTIWAVLISCPNCGYTETYNLLTLLGDGQDASC